MHTLVPKSMVSPLFYKIAAVLNLCHQTTKVSIFRQVCKDLSKLLFLSTYSNKYSCFIIAMAIMACHFKS